MKSITVYILALFVLFCQPRNLHAEELVITTVGDIMLAGKWAPQLRLNGYEHPFENVRNEFAASDITIANLESPVSVRGEEFSGKKYRFRADPQVAPALRAAGINLVTLANNHSMDFGEEALAETFQHLSENGIAWIGAGKNLSEARKMALYTVKGKKIAFLGFSLTQPVAFFAGQNRPGTSPGYDKYVVDDITRARSLADYVIVSFHWGKESNSTIQGYQRMTAHRSIDAGADVVFGHHPHILQGIERYKSGIIFYSLGNFAFASKGRGAADSAMIRLKLNGKNREAEIVPLDILHSRVGFQPRGLTGKRGAEVIDKLDNLSVLFETEIQRKDGRYFLTF